MKKILSALFFSMGFCFSVYASPTDDLVKAAQTYDVKGIKSALKKGADPNATIPPSNRVLMWSVYYHVTPSSSMDPAPSTDELSVATDLLKTVAKYGGNTKFFDDTKPDSRNFVKPRAGNYIHDVTSPERAKLALVMIKTGDVPDDTIIQSIDHVINDENGSLQYMTDPSLAERAAKIRSHISALELLKADLSGGNNSTAKQEDSAKVVDVAAIREKEEAKEAAIREKAEAARQAKERQQLASFRKSLAEGDSTSCGLVIEKKPKVVKIQPKNGTEQWVKLEEVFPPSKPCGTDVSNAFKVGQKVCKTVPNVTISIQKTFFEGHYQENKGNAVVAGHVEQSSGDNLQISISEITFINTEIKPESYTLTDERNGFVLRKSFDSISEHDGSALKVGQFTWDKSSNGWEACN